MPLVVRDESSMEEGGKPSMGGKGNFGRAQTSEEDW